LSAPEHVSFVNRKYVGVHQTPKEISELQNNTAT